jgi:hypothetical protein
VLEFVEGLDASQMLTLAARQGQTLPIELALYICAEIGHALSAAHESTDASGEPLGIVHRDVKPSNILIGWTGDVKLTDFGIALAKDRLEQTTVGTVKGTPNFMAPEQMLAGPLDARCDVFALGCVLHRLVAGHSPLSSESSMATFLASGRLTLADGLAPDVHAIVERATKLSRYERYETAAEMTEAMGAALASRVSREAKGLMREWLTPLRSVHTVPSLTSDVAPGAELDSISTLARALPTVPQRAAAATVTVPRGKGRRAAGVIVGLVVLVAGLGVVLAARLETQRPSAQPVEAPPPAPPAPVAAPAPGSAAAPPSEPTAEPDVVRPAPTEGEPPKAKPGRRRVRSEPAPARTAEVASGVVAFGGERLLNSQIVVDDRPEGYVPRVLTLKTGPHRVVLITPSGEQLGPSTIVVNERHTSLSPLRFVPP